MHGSGVNELALPNLQESYSLSISMYAAPALFTSKQLTNSMHAGIQLYIYYLVIVNISQLNQFYWV